MRFLPYLALAFTLAMHAQADTCPDHPTTLETMRDCYRPLLIFAPSPSDPQLLQQLSELQQHRPDLLDRNILIILDAGEHPIPVTDEARTLPLTKLGPDETRNIRERFKISNDSFTVLLIGKDGGEKLRRQNFVTVDTLNHIIDAMPMRKQEEKQ